MHHMSLRTCVYTHRGTRDLRTVKRYVQGFVKQVLMAFKTLAVQIRPALRMRHMSVTHTNVCIYIYIYIYIYNIPHMNTDVHVNHMYFLCVYIYTCIHTCMKESGIDALCTWACTDKHAFDTRKNMRHPGVQMHGTCRHSNT
jgi:hypothetical protein